MKINRKQFIYNSFILGGSFYLNRFGKFNLSTNNIKFGVISDLHYADNEPYNNNNRYYRESLTKLQKCISVLNSKNIDFLIQLGDFKDQDNENPNEKKTLEYLRSINHEFNKFKGPKFHALGNHDHDSISKSQFLNIVSNYGQTKTRSYYSFDMKGFHFVVLDGNYNNINGDEYDHGNFDWRVAFIPNKQIEWLKTDLQKTKFPTIIFVHHRLDKNAHNSNYCIQNSDKVKEILEESEKVLLVMQGHYHPGDISISNGIHYYTIRGAIEGSGTENNSFAIVNISNELKMNIKGYYQAKSI